MKNTKTHLYTAYLVVNAAGEFLNRRAYSGSVTGVWSPIQRAHIFRSALSAGDCARDINRRPGRAARAAAVVPVLLERRAPKRG